jgi:hypothetical protein
VSTRRDPLQHFAAHLQGRRRFGHILAHDLVAEVGPREVRYLGSCWAKFLPSLDLGDAGIVANRVRRRRIVPSTYFTPAGDW